MIEVRDGSHVMLGFWDVRNASGPDHPLLAGIVSRQRERQVPSKKTQKIFQVADAALNVLFGVEGILHSEALSGGWNQLHQSHCAFG